MTGRVAPDRDVIRRRVLDALERDIAVAEDVDRLVVIVIAIARLDERWACWDDTRGCSSRSVGVPFDKQCDQQRRRWRIGAAGLYGLAVPVDRSRGGYTACAGRKL